MAKHPGGRPTKYSATAQKLADAYLEECRKSKHTIPWIEELADKLDVDDSTIVNWTDVDDDDNPLNPEFFSTYKKLINLQKLRLKQTGIEMKKPTMPIFLLKVNHNMVETERRLVEVEGTMDVPGLTTLIRKYGQSDPKRD